MLVPVIGLVQLADQSRADRYTYLPLIGPFLAIYAAGFIFVGVLTLAHRLGWEG